MYLQLSGCPVHDFLTLANSYIFMSIHLFILCIEGGGGIENLADGCLFDLLQLRKINKHKIKISELLT